MKKPLCFAACAFPADGEAVFTGTAFLIRIPECGLALVTCAHLPIKMQPHTDFQLWPNSITLFNLPETRRVLLFDTEASRVPAFKFFQDRFTGTMSDVIVFPQAQMQELDPSFIESVQIIDCTKPPADPKPDEPICGYGFPDKHEIWPYAPPDCVEGTFKHRNVLMYEADLDLKVGHSGGPVFTQSGQFVGMMIGTTGPYARIVPADYIRWLAMQ